MLDVMGPYAVPTATASKALTREMTRSGNQWWVPFPMTDREAEDFRAFLNRKGVAFKMLSPLFENTIEAECDLCPYVFAWRYLRHELTFTALGKAQYENKAPF